MVTLADTFARYQVTCATWNMVYHQEVLSINAPQRFFEQFGENLQLSISKVLDSGKLILGPENESLEQELCDYLMCGYTILVGNGTDALEIALRSLAVKPGSQVITVANAGAYASTAITQVGARPLYVDIDEKHLQMDAHDLLQVLRNLDEKPSAVIVTHLYGQAAPISEICKIARASGIPVIEDCAQSMGASVGGKKLGSFGTMATTSFYPTKNLAGIGDGGAIFTSDENLATRARSLRQYGWASRYDCNLSGGRNSRLDEIQAAVIRLSLDQLDGRNKRRRDIHALYRDATRDQVGRFPHDYSDSFVAHLGVMVTPDRNRVQRFLESRGIGTDIHYPRPDYEQSAFRKFFTRKLPVTERIAGRILSVPLFPEMTEIEIAAVVEALRDIGEN